MDLDARHMDPETACLSCHGTGTILAPYDPRPGYPANAYLIVCGCGVYIERYPNAMNYQTGQTLPWTTHKQVMARAAGYVAWVDEPLRADIERLWEADDRCTYHLLPRRGGRDTVDLIVKPQVGWLRRRGLCPPAGGRQVGCNEH